MANLDLAAAHAEKGTALLQAGDYAGALAAYDAALALKPDYAAVLSNRGIACVQLGRLTEALRDFERATASDPHFANAHRNRGFVLERLGQPQAALDAYGRAIAADPNCLDAQFDCGVLLLKRGEPKAALERLDRAIALSPSHAEAHGNRGTALLNLGRRPEAIAAYTRAIAIQPDYAGAYSNRGNALMESGDLDAALSDLNTAIALDAHLFQAFLNRGAVLGRMARLADAVADFDRALVLDPSSIDGHLNRATALLSMGDFARGFADYEWRWKKRITPRALAQPLWLGKESLTEKTILIHCEQGLGDTIQFCRLVPKLAARARKVIFEVPPVLHRLLGGLAGDQVLVRAGDTLPPFDGHCPLLSLPLATGLTLDTIPTTVPYLSAELQRVARWRQTLGTAGFKVGICWQGKRAEIDKGRSIPLAQFAPLARVPGVRLISLQKGDGADQLDHLPSGMTVEHLGTDFDAGADAFLDAAAVISLCDLVITSDTAMAHLAGALGVPTWLALQLFPDWRWLRERPDTPWYPTMTLHRQRRDGDWADVFTRMARDLARRAAVR